MGNKIELPRKVAETIYAQMRGVIIREEIPKPTEGYCPAIWVTLEALGVALGWVKEGELTTPEVPNA